MKVTDLEKQARLFEGRDRWHIEDVTFSDGPHGLRIETEDGLGFVASKPANVFPAASCVSASFDTELLYEYGKRIAEECVDQGVDVLLGPGVNHKRSPLGGRNFEYYSEDPVLTAKLAGAYIRGVQSEGVGTSLKHFAVNSRERGRMVADAIIDERTLHELYLKQFEMIVKDAKPYTIMNAYNSVNGTYCCENQKLMDEAREWGFDGIFVSDWGAVADPVSSIRSGLNLEMPGRNGVDEVLLKTVQEGTLERKILSRSTAYLESFMEKCSASKENRFSQEKQEAFIEKAAEESIVLLKNRNVLPIDENMKIAVFGEGMIDPVIQGGGSSHVNAISSDSLVEVMKENGIDHVYYDPSALKNKDRVNEIKEADRVLVAVDLGEEYFRETSDRKNLQLDVKTDRLIEALSRINQNIIVIIYTGAPVLLPWRNRVKGILHAGFAGAKSGKALYEILFGKISPSGRLSETWPLKESDVPCYEQFNKDLRTLEYREGIFSGYRYYDTFHVPVLYPFGYGLSYTSFTYEICSITENDEINVNIRVRNTGNYDARCVIQLYQGMKESHIARANKELIAFESLFLKQKEEKEVCISLRKDDFAYYDVRKKQWCVEEGTYQLYVCRNVNDVADMKEVYLFGEKDPYSSLSRSFVRIDENGVHVNDRDFERMLGHRIPVFEHHEYNVNTTLADLKATKIGTLANYLAAVAMKFISTNGVAEESVFEGPIRQVLWADDNITWDTLYELVRYLNHPTIRGTKDIIALFRTKK